MQARQRSLEAAVFRPSKARRVSESSLSAGSTAGTVARCGRVAAPRGPPSQPGMPRWTPHPEPAPVWAGPWLAPRLHGEGAPPGLPPLPPFPFTPPSYVRVASGRTRESRPSSPGTPAPEQPRRQAQEAEQSTGSELQEPAETGQEISGPQRWGPTRGEGDLPQVPQRAWASLTGSQQTLGGNLEVTWHPELQALGDPHAILTTEKAGG